MNIVWATTTVLLLVFFSWMDGSPVHYAAWAQGEPNFADAQENCVVLNKKDGELHNFF